MADTDSQTDEATADAPQDAPEADASGVDASEVDASVEADATEQTTDAVDGDDAVQTPEFPDLKPTGAPAGAVSDLNRLFDVQVTVAAELGKTRVPIQKLLGLTEGSVFELDRSISSPIELVAQGVPLGNGEVVVIDDSFAIRIKEIYANPS